MLKPSHYIRICSLMITLATLAGCADEGSLLAPEVSPSFARGLGNGGNGGRGNGGEGDESDAPLVEDFDFWDPSAWIPRHHVLGLGLLDRENVSHRGSKLLLTLPAGSYGGAEIQSASRVQFRDVEVRLRTPRAPGSISALFLYEFVYDDTNDEIDIEIFNDGSRKIWFTTWVEGGTDPTNHVEHTLPFDPAVRFHNYRIEWSSSRVRFLVDGVLMQEWTEGVPQDAMYVMSNAWWPTWMSGPTLDESQMHEIDRIIY
jgi:beta-glucanase (GH16 family)